jgi:DNA-binding NarL/FixJ family response regulator
MKVFLVDDSQAVRERLGEMIACISDIELVACADNEDDAIEGILKFLPEVVIMDLILLCGSGIGVLRRLRLLALTTRVIVLTNSSAPCYRERCLELGADYFFDKSHEISKLEALLIQMAGSFNHSIKISTNVNSATL